MSSGSSVPRSTVNLHPDDLFLAKKTDPPRSDDLAPRQRDVLDFICATVAQRGLPPTYREIGDALDIASTNGVADHIKALVRKGYLKKINAAGSLGGLARGLQLTAKARSVRRSAVVPVPVLRVDLELTSSQSVLAEENYDHTLHLNRTLLPANSQVFAFGVADDAMAEERIFVGDIVIVRSQDTARNGEMVAVVIDGKLTVRFFFREEKRARLQPANGKVAPTWIGAGVEVGIQGLVVGVWRRV
jgi:repressor LexA